MQNCDPPAIDLDPATLVAIVAAAKPDKPLSDETLEALRGWLSDGVNLAIRRANATSLGKGDVDRLEATYTEFRKAIADLQGSDDPPPVIPVSESGWTEWDHWLIGHRHFGFRRGRPDGTDWRLMAALLALYETVSGHKASAAQADGPTMRFLESALRALADAGNQFAPPNAEALRKQMPELRASYLAMEKRALAEIISKAAGE